MLEYPEIKTIVSQMETELIGKTVVSGSLVKKNSNIFMDESHAARYSLLSGGIVLRIECSAPDIYIKLDNGHGILICQCGGKILYNRSKPPKNYNIILDFSDGSSLTYTMMLFSLGIYAVSHEEWQKRVRENKKFDPFSASSFNDYLGYIKDKPADEIKKPVKTFLASNISGVMSTFAAEILLYAKIHPSIQLQKLSDEQNKRIYEAMRSVLADAYKKGGRASEVDLYGQKGSYIAMAERKHIGENCPICGNILGKISVGGVTAFCPVCQTKNDT
jgi:formamidopyrimidine-DNA glycosylase